MSCSLNAWSPENTVLPAAFASSATVSNIAEPVRRVCRKEVSSATATAMMREESAISSG